MPNSNSIAYAARLILGMIRVLNGTAALFFPEVLLHRLDETAFNPSGEYVFRMFGIRTVLIGLDVLRDDPKAIQQAPIIHASDTLAAFLAARSGLLPHRTAKVIVAISALNTVLALLMRFKRN